MARGKKTMFELQGFDDFLEQLQEAGKNMEVEGRKCFETCAENLYDALYENGKKAGLSERLLEQIEEKFIENSNANIWSYEVGWKKQKPASDPLPDVYKVIFYNYGTPKRTTRKGWNRGKESPHPQGSHGFIKKAKLSAIRKNKKVQSDALKKIIGGLK